MRTLGWALGVAASLVLGPIVYVVARLVQGTPEATWAPVQIPARSVTSSGFRRA